MYCCQYLDLYNIKFDVIMRMLSQSLLIRRQAMKITFEAEEGVDQPDGVMVFMAKRNEQGALVTGWFQPVEIDRHPDTLRQIGARIVDFAQGK
jgi:hypothetical protein